jgi:hypothetical protein
VKDADLRDMFKKATKDVCTSAVVVLPHCLSPTPSTSSTIKTPHKKEEVLMTSNQQMKEISNCNTPLISCAAQYRTVT